MAAVWTWMMWTWGRQVERHESCFKFASSHPTAFPIRCVSSGRQNGSRIDLKSFDKPVGDLLAVRVSEIHKAGLVEKPVQLHGECFSFLDQDFPARNRLLRMPAKANIPKPSRLDVVGSGAGLETLRAVS